MRIWCLLLSSLLLSCTSLGDFEQCSTNEDCPQGSLCQENLCVLVILPPLPDVVNPPHREDAAMDQGGVEPVDSSMEDLPIPDRPQRDLFRPDRGRQDQALEDLLEDAREPLELGPTDLRADRTRPDREVPPEDMPIGDWLAPDMILDLTPDVEPDIPPDLAVDQWPDWACVEEVCDGVDNDCDGAIDEGLTNCLTTLAGSSEAGYEDGRGVVARFGALGALTWDPWGFLLVADPDNQRIRNVSEEGDTSTFIGPEDAALARPWAVASGEDDLLIADSGNHVLRLYHFEMVETVAGQLGSPGVSDGQGALAQFNDPGGLDLLPGRLLLALVADRGNHCIRSMTGLSRRPPFTVTTVAGVCGEPGMENGAVGLLNNPWSVKISDDENFLFIADTGNHCIRWQDRASTMVGVVAGECGRPGAVDGPNQEALFQSPKGILQIGEGILLVADSANHLIRRIDIGNNFVETVAGQTAQAGNIDGPPLGGALLNDPVSLLQAPDGAIYISEGAGHTIRRLILP